MDRLAMVACVAAVLAGGAMADGPVTTFTNASSVNLLERWNSDGTYGMPIKATCTYVGGPVNGRVDTVTNANFSTALNSYNLACLANYTSLGTTNFSRSSVLGEDRVIEITYTFDTPVYLDRVSCVFGGTTYAPNNYQWLINGNATPVIDKYQASRLAGSYVDPLPQGTLVSTLTFRMTADGCPNGDPNFYNNVRLGGLGAYLAAGQSLAIDGTYNIFYQETAKPKGNFNAAWTNHVMGENGGKPGAPGVCTWEFSQAYEMCGFMLTQYDTTRALDKMRLEVSLTGEDGSWTSIIPESLGLLQYPDGSFRYVDKRQYIQLTTPVVGQYVRLTWDNNTNSNTEVEISEFQLFGKPIPEPATMTLLALGGVALLRRRRR